MWVVALAIAKSAENGNRKEVIVKRQELKDDLAKWIEPDVIAEAIVNQMDEEKIEYTLENGQQIWLNHLEELHHYL